MLTGSRRVEHLSLSSQKNTMIVTTVEDSVPRTEMTVLESQEEDDPKRILFFKPMTRVSRSLTTGWLINSLIFSAQHTKGKHNRWLKAGVSIVGTSS
jgi:hypothetical protein